MEEGAINSRQIGYRTCLILVRVETMVCENEYILIDVTEIHSPDRGGSSPTVIRLIIIDTENSGILRDGKVGMN